MAQEDIEAIRKYEYGALAATLLNQGDQIHSVGALEEFAYTAFGEDVEGLVAGATTSPQGIQTAASVYAGKYAEAQSKVSISELAGYYDDILTGYLQGGDLETIRNTLGAVGDQNFGGAREKVGKAGYLLDGQRKGLYNFPEEEVTGAKETVRKFSPAFKVLDVLGEMKMQKLRPKVEDRVNKKALKGLAEQIRQAA